MKMGLDMYLYAKKYTSKYDNDKGKLNKKIWALFPSVKPDENLNGAEVLLEVGYWRKANHIHKWFVDNVQDGKDECQDSYVSREDLKKLLGLVEDVLKNKKKAAVLLPVASGFFFGGVEYDDYYFAALENTKTIIQNCLKLDDGFSFEYH